MSNIPNISFLHAATSVRYQSPVTCIQPDSEPVARPVATSAEDVRLSGRQEQPQGGGLLSRMSAQVIRPFVALQKWIGNLLGRDATHAPVQVSSQLSREQDAEMMGSWKEILDQLPKERRQGNKEVSRLEGHLIEFAMGDPDKLQQSKQAALRIALDGLAKASQFSGLTGEVLAQRHHTLAENSGGIRAAATPLDSIESFSQNAGIRAYAHALAEREIEGIVFVQWGTTGMAATALVGKGDPAQLRRAAAGFDKLSRDVGVLEWALRREVKGEDLPDLEPAYESVVRLPTSLGPAEPIYEEIDESLLDALRGQRVQMSPGAKFQAEPVYATVDRSLKPLKQEGQASLGAQSSDGIVYASLVLPETDPLRVGQASREAEPRDRTTYATLDFLRMGALREVQASRETESKEEPIYQNVGAFRKAVQGEEVE